MRRRVRGTTSARRVSRNRGVCTIAKASRVCVALRQLCASCKRDGARFIVDGASGENSGFTRRRGDAEEQRKTRTQIRQKSKENHKQKNVLFREFREKRRSYGNSHFLHSRNRATRSAGRHATSAHTVRIRAIRGASWLFPHAHTRPCRPHRRISTVTTRIRIETTETHGYHQILCGYGCWIGVIRFVSVQCIRAFSVPQFAFLASSGTFGNGAGPTAPADREEHEGNAHVPPNGMRLARVHLKSHCS